MSLHPPTFRPTGFDLAGVVLAVDPGMSVDSTALVAGRVGRDRQGGARLAVDLLHEMTAPCTPEAVVALIDEAAGLLRREVRCEPLVVLDVSNNAALLAMLGRVMSFKSILPVSIGGADDHSPAPSPLAVTTSDGRTRQLSKWVLSRRALLGGVEAMGSTRMLTLPPVEEQPAVARLREQMAAAAVEVTASGRRRVVVPTRVHDDLVVALAMGCWAVPAVLQAGRKSIAAAIRTGHGSSCAGWT